MFIVRQSSISCLQIQVPELESYVAKEHRHKDQDVHRLTIVDVLSPNIACVQQRNDAVDKLLIAARSALRWCRGTNILAPNKYVIPGLKGEKIGMEEDIWPDYFAAQRE